MRAEGFVYNLDILYGVLEIGKLQFLIKKNKKKFSAVIFFQFLVIKAWIRIRIHIGLQPQTLDPDPDPEKMNTDPQPCLKVCASKQCPDWFEHGASSGPLLAT